MDRKSYDVVVIGAGIGGLCAAARLSHAGYKTMVLEKMSILGGRYTHVDYKGYLVPTGAVVISYGEKDPVLRTLNEVGGDTSFEMRPMSSRSHLPKYRIGGEDHEMPAKGALWHVISIASRNRSEEERLVKAIRRAFTWQEPSDAITVSEWLLSLTDNSTIYNIFQNLSHQLDGGNAYEIPAGQLFREMRGLLTVSPLVPRNGLKDVIDSLAKVITDNGGEILTRSRVQSIVVEDGAATGVEAKCQGNELRIGARSLVSNVGPKRTVALAGEEHFDRGYLKEVRGQRQLQGILFILSSDGPLYDWPGGLYTIDTRRPYLWHDFTLIWPEWAPRGKNWTYCWKTPESTTFYDPKKEYQVFLADLKETFPMFHEQGGEILLANNYCGEWPAYRALPGCDLRQKTPVENLYNVGDAVKTPEFVGGSGAAESARIVVEDIINRIKL